MAGEARAEAIVEDGEEEEVVEWEKLLPRVPVSVMVVESDDSTRQIVAALLRKCSYKVAAVSNGLKAWELLKEKPNSIDLILTEVELPSLSGFNLLTMIMDDEACNSIPVIMMSSHDSMSMVFKCMLRGAADFLVKPIRKNELRNLWQHVWRRQLANSAHGSVRRSQDVGQTKQNVNDMCENGILPTANVPLLQEDKECSEHDSDAQSSCTRSGMEADSEHKEKLELKQPKLQKDFLNDLTFQNAGKLLQLDCAAVTPEIKAEDIANSPKSLHDVVMDQNYYLRNDEERTHNNVAGCQIIDSQSQSKQAFAEKVTFQSEALNATELVHESDAKNNLNCMPHLELSLRRYEESNNDMQRNGDFNNGLNHSYSSAFSVYCNRALQPTSSSKTSLENQSNDNINNSFNYLQDQGSTNAALYSNIIPTMSLGNTKNTDSEHLVLDGSAVKCTPLRVIPFFGIPFDNLSSKCAPVMQPILYQQPAHPFWTPVSSIWQEQAMHASPSYQSGGKDYHQNDHGNRSPLCHAADKKDKPEQPLEESLHVSTGTGASASSSMCSGAMNCDNAASNQIMSNIVNVSVDNGHNGGLFNREGTKKIDPCRVSQREAALNKFRLKRKERCFGKKVRYQSRKVLAEQRPRVKGQFVRKEQLNS